MEEIQCRGQVPLPLEVVVEILEQKDQFHMKV